jgi:hypothetical protein
MTTDCEFEDARKEHMNDCSYYRSLHNIIDRYGVSSIRHYIGRDYNSSLYRHLDADRFTELIPVKIKKLSLGPAMYDMEIHAGNITQFPDSLLNEGNPTLAHNTVSQTLLRRVKKDNNYSILHLNNIYYLNITENICENDQTTYVSESKKNKKLTREEKLKRKILKNNNPPVKQLSQKTFKYKNMNNSIKIGKQRNLKGQRNKFFKTHC